VTNAFQIGKFDLVSFSVMGCRVGKATELRLAEAMVVFLDELCSHTMKELCNGVKRHVAS
jgi:hypothetical protein